MKGTMMNFPLTLVPIFERAGKLFGQVEIVSRRPDRTLHRTTFGDFYTRARRLAEALQAAGLQRGDRVATLMWNHSAHMEAYFGVPLAGGVVHTLNLRLGPPELGYIINHAADRFLIVDDVLLPLWEKVRDQVKVERVFVVPFSEKPVPAGYESYEDLLAQASGRFEYPAFDENDAAVMCYTSGTTGTPKGVLYSHRSLVLHSFGVALADAFGTSQRDVSLLVVPMFHANAWGLPFVCAMLGSKIVLPGPFYDAESLLDLFESEQVTYAAGVPTVWMCILDALEKNPGRWKLAQGVRMTVGGAAAPESMIRRFATLGLEVCHSWGMTEMTPAGTTSRVKSYLRSLPEDEQYAIRAKQGLPFPFVELRAMTDSGEAPWDGATMGELQVRGPWIAASYYKNEAEQDKWTRDGWFRTGDVVTIDAEGYIKIADRTKDLIKSGGEWISSVDLENALMGHPAVKEAAVIGLPHPKWLERPLAVVVLRDDAASAAAANGADPAATAAIEVELRALLASKFAKWQLPDGFAFVKEIPRTTVGKFKKSALREQFRDWQWR